jgi:nucleoside-diphosphate-sugar epimerase
MTVSHVLLTGFPANELARKVLKRLLELETSVRVTCLVPKRFMEQAYLRLARMPGSETSRLAFIEGDVAAIDLGLSGGEYAELRRSVNLIHHCAAVTYSGAPLAMAQRVNVQGTCEIVEFAREASTLERVIHWSTLGATWDRDGVVWEDELHAPESGALMRTRYKAERVIAKLTADVPVTVLRPAMLAGDSKTGELARVEGAGLLIAGLLTAPRDVPIMRPGDAHIPLQSIPIDYAVEAGLTLARASAAEQSSRTFQIVDPAPPSLGDALTLVANMLGKPRPRGLLPPPLMQALVRMPFVEKLVHAQRALLDEIGRDVLYDDRNARPILTAAKLSCPPFASYADKLIAHVRRERKSDRPTPPGAQFDRTPR